MWLNQFCTARHDRKGLSFLKKLDSGIFGRCLRLKLEGTHVDPDCERATLRVGEDQRWNHSKNTLNGFWVLPQGRIPIYLDDGDIDFSSFKIGSFNSAASIGSLTRDGFYTADGSGVGIRE